MGWWGGGVAGLMDDLSHDVRMVPRGVAKVVMVLGRANSVFISS